jgi:hypothetical protein
MLQLVKFKAKRVIKLHVTAVLICEFLAAVSQGSFSLTCPASVSDHSVYFVGPYLSTLEVLEVGI